MKKIFISIGLAALMLVSGTNYYLANNTNSYSSLRLEDIEANADSNGEAGVPPWLGPAAQVVGIVAGLVAIGKTIYDYSHSDDVVLGDVRRYFVKQDSKTKQKTYLIDCKGSGNQCNLRDFRPFYVTEN